MESSGRKKSSSKKESKEKTHKGDGKQKESKKETKKESRKSVADDPIEQLSKDIASLKEKIRAARTGVRDVATSEYFTNNASNFDKGKEPTEQRKLAKGHSNSIESLSWANTHTDLILTAGLDGRLFLWHAPSGNKLAFFKLKSQWIQTCALRSFQGDTGIVASAGMDNVCTLWSLRDNSKPLGELEGHEAFIPSIKFLDDQTIITASQDSTAVIWDAQKKKKMETFYFPIGASSVAISKSSDVLVGLNNGTVVLCDQKSGKQVADFEAHEEAISSLTYFPNDTAFASASDDQTIHLYDVRSRDNCLQNYARENPDEDGELTSIAFSQSGRFLFAGYTDIIGVWDTADGKLLYTLNQPAKTSSLELNNDGSALASGCYDNDARIWSI